MIHCPYEARHRMKRSRFMWHFNRCKARPLVQHQFGHCKYNFFHILKVEELKIHQLSCPDSVIVSNVLSTSTSVGELPQWSWDDFQGQDEEAWKPVTQPDPEPQQELSQLYWQPDQVDHLVQEDEQALPTFLWSVLQGLSQLLKLCQRRKK